jgi:hypothetical protein
MMKHIRAMLTATGLLVVAGAMGTARAEDGITLYTGAIEATHFACNAVNVSSKPLKITISVIDMDGLALSVTPTTEFLPGTEVASNFSTPPYPDDADGYCKFQVYGTDDRGAVRAILNAALLRTVPGTTISPILLSRVLEAR